MPILSEWLRTFSSEKQNVPALRAGTLSAGRLHKSAQHLPAFGSFPEKQEFVAHDFGDVLSVAFLVLITSVDQLALNSDLLAFLDEVLDEICGATPGHHIVPLGFGDFLALGVLVDLIGGDGELGQLSAGFEGQDFRSASHVPDQLYSVS